MKAWKLTASHLVVGAVAFAIGAAIAVPVKRPSKPAAAPEATRVPIAALLGARRNANETSAIATLRNVCSAQAQFQACGVADADADGVGEYGTFRELAGGIEIRGSRDAGTLNPPVLSGAFRNPDDRGFVSRSGYLFAIFLPAEDFTGYGADARDADWSKVNADLAETTWCCYAWPIDPGETGNRAFLVNQMGDIVATDAVEYDRDHPPAADAGFLPPTASVPGTTGPAGSICDRMAVNAEGRDGHRWRPVN